MNTPKTLLFVAGVATAFITTNLQASPLVFNADSGHEEYIHYLGYDLWRFSAALPSEYQLAPGTPLDITLNLTDSLTLANAPASTQPQLAAGLQATNGGSIGFYGTISLTLGGTTVLAPGTRVAASGGPANTWYTIYFDPGNAAGVAFDDVHIRFEDALTDPTSYSNFEFLVSVGPGSHPDPVPDASATAGLVLIGLLGLLGFRRRLSSV